MDFKKGNNNEICSAEIDAIEQWMTNMTTLEEYTTFDCSNIKKLIDNIISIKLNASLAATSEVRKYLFAEVPENCLNISTTLQIQTFNKKINWSY